VKWNGLYDIGRNLFALGEIKWKPRGSVISAILVDPEYYLPDLSAHTTLEDIPTNSIIKNNGSFDIEGMPKLSLITPENGICDAEDITFKGIRRGDKIGYLILVLNDQNNSLICCINLGGLDNYIVSSGRPISIGWSNSDSKIFKL
jgi:hypothetical protein